MKYRVRGLTFVVIICMLFSAVALGDSAQGGDTAAQVYAIDCAQTQGLGIIRTYPAGKAAQGSEVVIAAMPAQGWTIQPGSLKVETLEDDRKVEVADDRFIMPDGECCVSAVFLPLGHAVAVQKSECFDIKLSYLLDGDEPIQIDENSSVPAGALVNVAITPLRGCAPEGMYVLEQNSQTLPKPLESQGGTSFIMPDCDVTVYVKCSNASHISAAELAILNKSQSADSGMLSADTPLPCEARVQITGSKLRLREDCAENAGVVAAYASGTIVSVSEFSADKQWAKVRVEADGKVGWMNAQYLSVNLSAESPELTINVIMPAVDINAPRLVKQKRERTNEKLVFKHILFI